jgi:hypothetical protein
MGLGSIQLMKYILIIETSTGEEFSERVVTCQLDSTENPLASDGARHQVFLQCKAERPMVEEQRVLHGCHRLRDIQFSFDIDTNFWRCFFHFQARQTVAC